MRRQLPIRVLWIGTLLISGNTLAASALQQAAHQRLQQMLAAIRDVKSTNDFTATYVNKAFNTRVIPDDEGFSRSLMLDGTWWMAISTTTNAGGREIMFSFGKNEEGDDTMPFCASTVSELVEKLKRAGMSHNVMHGVHNSYDADLFSDKHFDISATHAAGRSEDGSIQSCVDSIVISNHIE